MIGGYLSKTRKKGQRERRLSFFHAVKSSMLTTTSTATSKNFRPNPHSIGPLRVPPPHHPRAQVRRRRALGDHRRALQGLQRQRQRVRGRRRRNRKRCLSFCRPGPRAPLVAVGPTPRAEALARGGIAARGARRRARQGEGRARRGKGTRRKRRKWKRRKWKQEQRRRWRRGAREGLLRELDPRALRQAGRRRPGPPREVPNGQGAARSSRWRGRRERRSTRS